MQKQFDKVQNGEEIFGIQSISTLEFRQLTLYLQFSEYSILIKVKNFKL